MNILISIIVPVYKVELYLDKCIESIVNQTYKNLEIILVDDGSTDQCPDKCDKWALKDARIEVIHKKNGGLSDARNEGIKKTTGEYIIFIDSDDWIENNMIEIMMQALLKEKADICACGIRYNYDTHSKDLTTKYYTGNSSQTLARLYNNTMFPVAAWNKLYRRELWDKVLFPKGKICEDAFTTYLLIDAAKKIVQIPDVLYNYRIRPNSIMTSQYSHKNMDQEEAWRENYMFMRKKYPEHIKKSFDFYLFRVNNLIHTMNKVDQQKFNKDYNYLKGILKKNVCYILFKSEMSLKQRCKLLYDIKRL